MLPASSTATASTSSSSSWCRRRTARTIEARLTPEAYLQIVAATNFKQRTRKMLEYYHADRLNYAVIGTPNRLEYDQGFFVKNGDGAADIKPIAHLYKTQVYALARAPGRARGDPQPAADHRHLLAAADPGGVLLLAAVRQMDLCLYAKNHGIPADRGRRRAGPDGRRRSSACSGDIDAKRKMADYLHSPPITLPLSVG